MLNFSIKQGLLMVALVATLIAGLKFGGFSAWLGILVYVCGWFSQIICLLVGARSRRAYAVGFLLPSICYLAVTVLISDQEYQAANGVLPQSSFVQRLIQRDLADFDWDEFEQSQTEYVIEAEAYLEQMTIPRLALVHLATSLTLGLIGGWYARYVYSESQLETD